MSDGVFRRSAPPEGQEAAPPEDVLLVETPEALRSLVGKLRGERVIALDTEFIRERTYVPRLELVQIATRKGLVAVIDYGKIGLRKHDPLAAVLTDPKVLKAFHAADQDLEMLQMLTGEVPGPIWDTQLVTALFGYSGRTGYTAIVGSLLGVQASTDESLTDWSRRPLTAAQIRYAAEDVRHLLALYDVERERLAEIGREQWALEECAHLRDRIRGLLERRADPTTVHQRVRGWTRLDRRQLGILLHLARWREEEARRRDIGRGAILKDEMLVELARRGPARQSDLRDIRTLRPREIRRYGREIIEAVRAGEEIPEPELPERPTRGTRLSEAERALVSLLQAVLKAVAIREQVSPSLLASTAELEELVRDWGDEKDLGEHRILQGWRKELVGQDIVAVLEGRRGVRWDPRRGNLDLETPRPRPRK